MLRHPALPVLLRKLRITSTTALTNVNQSGVVQEITHRQADLPAAGKLVKLTSVLQKTVTPWQH
ncbi:uncharacterized protein LOC120846780 [Ixodes scapularis]|uniref:uncharacterized protein LOC120846780 n=1 Tax=Ixodes scapularis TaxID=6945 RepID=UPI001A9E4372|nr:uncharacterized protein LOC120846780 [Ixodes scapularis]